MTTEWVIRKAYSLTGHEENRILAAIVTAKELEGQGYQFEINQSGKFEAVTPPLTFHNHFDVNVNATTRYRLTRLGSNEEINKAWFTGHWGAGALDFPESVAPHPHALDDQICLGNGATSLNCDDPLVELESIVAMLSGSVGPTHSATLWSKAKGICRHCFETIYESEEYVQDGNIYHDCCHKYHKRELK